MDTLLTVLVTGDGSSTVSAGGLTYHSSHGAIQESQHVFIRAGFEHAVAGLPEGTAIHILEMGFGTGLNALLTALAAKDLGLQIHYTSIEKYLLPREVWPRLNYGKMAAAEELFSQLHDAEWDQEVCVTPGFILKKISGDLADILLMSEPSQYSLIYYDAFAPDDQPELWTPEIFMGIARVMANGGILSTYCAKGQVRRNMLAAGLNVERIPGPPGKREMMRAGKP